jgi:hypothetical protein
MLDSLVTRTLRTVNDADAAAAALRVAEIRTQRHLQDSALVEHLIKQKGESDRHGRRRHLGSSIDSRLWQRCRVYHRRRN